MVFAGMPMIFFNDKLDENRSLKLSKTTTFHSGRGYVLSWSIALDDILGAPIRIGRVSHSPSSIGLDLASVNISAEEE
jgi:hypothetical protein